MGLLSVQLVLYCKLTALLLYVQAGKFRSSLLLDLDVDMDIEGIDLGLKQTSPSAKSVDLGATDR